MTIVKQRLSIPLLEDSWQTGSSLVQRLDRIYAIRGTRPLFYYDHVPQNPRQVYPVMGLLEGFPFGPPH